MVDEWGITYCKNCGDESHCGGPYLREERNWQGKLLGQIEVCKYCRCEVCRQPDWGQREKQMVGVDCNNPECNNPLCTCDPCDCSAENPCKCCAEQDDV